MSDEQAVQNFHMDAAAYLSSVLSVVLNTMSRVKLSPHDSEDIDYTAICNTSIRDLWIKMAPYPEEVLHRQYTVEEFCKVPIEILEGIGFSRAYINYLPPLDIGDDTELLIEAIALIPWWVYEFIKDGEIFIDATGTKTFVKGVDVFDWTVPQFNEHIGFGFVNREVTSKKG